MCEYCGCQAIRAIAELTDEHELVVNLTGEVRRALRHRLPDEAAELVRAMAVILGPHTAVEEQALFPAMSEEFGDHMSGLVEEHRLIEAMLGEVAQGTPTDITWPDRLDRGLQLLRDHIHKEQDGVFPAALALLTTAQWEQVDAVRGRHLAAASEG